MIRPEVASLKAYVAGKPHEELERELGVKNIIKMASNENCLGPSPLALEAGQKALATCHLYPDGDHYYLKQALSLKTGFKPEQMFVGCGTTEIVQLLCYAILTPERNAVFAAQTFSLYGSATRATGATAIEVPLDENDGHDLPAIAAAVNPRTGLVFVANPSNPTGTYVTHAEVEELVERVPEGALAVIDEAYFEYVTKSDYADAHKLLQQGRRLLVLRTFSKVYGLAGMRVGYAVGPPEVIDALNRLRSPFNTSRVGLSMAVAAVEDQRHVEESRRHNSIELQYLGEGLTRLGYSFLPSVANFLLVECGRSAEEVFRSLLQHGIIVRPMRAFGFPTRVRISVGTREQNDRLLTALKELGLT